MALGLDILNFQSFKTCMQFFSRYLEMHNLPFLMRINPNYSISFFARIQCLCLLQKATNAVTKSPSNLMKAHGSFNLYLHNNH